ncbi:3-phosphoshikimate 1-carboxyvinyltransferase [Desulfitibacter alkalitolerans]|uniref:3-phosphoshikimate 1-carboxyvinyltransferase n=1 Tax=Desulfitibacter alkalitolerans TaxID=264641 RepID=UPI00054EADBA|nr:3-phosphoshikimate 1-carboxyvinyltransferase [Desulfitibacter alkalitolerans]
MVVNNELIIEPKKGLNGTVRVPGDKSISHRAVMLGSLADGVTRIKGFLMGEDCLSTVRCFQEMGVAAEINEDNVLVYGKGLHGLSEPQDVLDVGNSGTTIRLMSGILAGQSFISVVTGDSSIRKRPMGRVTKPLKEMGATILGRQKGELAPLTISGGSLRPISYKTPVASAQIKSSILLAGLFANGWTEVIEPEKSRDHSERMLRYFGAEVEVDGLAVRIKGHPTLTGREIQVPGDISSAAFLLVAGAIVPDSRVVIKDVGLNPTRTGIIDVLKEMGANLKIIENTADTGEPLGDLIVETSSLQGIEFGGQLIPRLVDEIPVIAVAAACAGGITEIRDAAELKVKESNRIEAICQGLQKMGVDIEELPDGLRIKGGKPIRGGVTLDSQHDHRIAMALAVAGLVADKGITIKNAEAINVSFPGFKNLLDTLAS